MVRIENDVLIVNDLKFRINNHTVSLLDIFAETGRLPSSQINSLEWELETKAYLHSIGISDFVRTTQSANSDASYFLQYSIDGTLLNFMMPTYRTSTVILCNSMKSAVIVLEGIVSLGFSGTIDERFFDNVYATVYRHGEYMRYAEKLAKFKMERDADFDSMTRSITGTGTCNDSQLKSIRMTLSHSMSLSGTWVNITDVNGDEYYSAYYDVVNKTSPVRN